MKFLNAEVRGKMKSKQMKYEKFETNYTMCVHFLLLNIFCLVSLSANEGHVINAFLQSSYSINNLMHSINPCPLLQHVALVPKLSRLVRYKGISFKYC